MRTIGMKMVKKRRRDRPDDHRASDRAWSGGDLALPKGKGLASA